MIISRTPFRISFAGGGSDLASYYNTDEGAVLSTTINKYIYIAIHPYFESNKIQLKYSKTELVDTVGNIQHPLLREIIKKCNLTGIDINSIADIPAGTGLGSSSSFTVGVLNAAYAYQEKIITPECLSKQACEIEIDKLGSPIGKQDQYAAAYGGLNFIKFFADGSVDVQKIIMNSQSRESLNKNLIMIYTGDNRAANSILNVQNKNYASSKYRVIQKDIVGLAYELKKILESDNIDEFGVILREGWNLKKRMAEGISNSNIETIYKKGLSAGATGGKLLGAGGGGFILFYCPQNTQDEFRKEMSQLRELEFNFDSQGSKIIYIGETQ